MIATIADLRDATGSKLEGLEDAFLQFWLNSAQRSVVAQGIPESNPRFQELQIAKSMDLLETSGELPYDISSESVHDVSTSYDTGKDDTMSWGKMYKVLLMEIQGYRNRVC
jgi:hypothetical protein